MRTKEDICKTIIKHDGCYHRHINCTVNDCPYNMNGPICILGIKNNKPSYDNIVERAKVELKRIKLKLIREILK